MYVLHHNTIFSLSLLDSFVWRAERVELLFSVANTERSFLRRTRSIHHQGNRIPLEQVCYMNASSTAALPYVYHDAWADCEDGRADGTSKVHCMVRGGVRKMRESAPEALAAEIRPGSTEREALRPILRVA